MNINGKEFEFNPDAMVYSQFGLDNYEKKDYSSAVREFTKAINAQPTNQNFYTMRGTAYEDLGNDIEAAKDFKKALELSPDDYVAAYRLGMVFFREKDFNNAIKWLRLSYNNAPDGDLTEHLGLGTNNIIFVAKKLVAGNLGNFLTQVKDYEEGFKYLDEAMKIDPNYPNPYMVKGLALAQMGKVNEGISCLEKAEKLGFGQASMVIQMLKNM
jgi:tetratricopeptide (TPR) repeat protein